MNIHVTAALLALAVSLGTPASGTARQVFDPTDPDFAGAVTLRLPPPGFAGGSLVVFETQAGGVTFRLECRVSPCPVDPGGIFSGGVDGLRITISPPVPAIGFVGLGVDGLPGGRFVGSAGTEAIEAPTSPVFFGAAGIGDIDEVELSRQGHFFQLTEVRFVSPSPPPGVPPVGVEASASTGSDDPAEQDSDGDPGTAEAFDDDGDARATGHARAELNTGFVRRRVQARSGACGGGGGPPNDARAEARVVQRFVSALSHGAPTPNGVDVRVAIDFDGRLYANRLVTTFVCQHRCPPDFPPVVGQIVAGVRGRVTAYPATGAAVQLLDETAALDYALARDEGFFPSPGWADAWRPGPINPFPILYQAIGSGRELQLFDVVSEVLTVPLGEQFAIELRVETSARSGYFSTIGLPGCAVADFFHTGEIDVTTTTPGVVLIAVDDAGDPIAPPTQDDADGDGVADPADDCPESPNAEQADADGDGVGDVCDLCPADADPGREDADGDGRSDACDLCPAVADDDHPFDGDDDGFGDRCDNAPFVANPDQADADGDGIGDVVDGCPGIPNTGQEDADEDGVGDACDACPADPDPACTPGGEQVCGDCTDDDGDGLADLLDPDCAAALAPLALKRGALAPGAAGDEDALLLHATVPAVPGGLDPRADGMTISLAGEGGPIACVEVPPGDGWKTNRGETRWIRAGADGTVGVLARPEIDAIQLTVNLKRIDAAAASPGDVHAAIRIGEHAWRDVRPWRAATNGRKLVTP